MSAADSVSQNAREQSVNTRLDIDNEGTVKPLAVKKSELALLQIDETYESDCDPYNSTGQFLVSAIKAKYED